MRNDKCQMSNGASSAYPTLSIPGSGKAPARNRTVHRADMSNANRLTREVDCVIKRDASERMLGFLTISLAGRHKRLERKGSEPQSCMWAANNRLRKFLFRDAENLSE